MQSALVLTPKTSENSWQGQWLGIAGFLALLSFTWLPHSYTRMVGWPYCLWWQGAFCLLVAWGIWLSRQFSQPLRLLGYRLDWIVLFIAISSGLSALTAQFQAVAGLNFLLLTSYGTVLYVAVSWLRHTPSLKTRLWLSLATVGTITHLISLAFWRPNPTMWVGGDFYTAIRNAVPLGHHNFVGGYCLLLLPLVTGFALTQTGVKRWIGYGAIALNLLALYASGSRGALLGAVALGLLTLVWLLIHHRPKTLKHWVLGLLALLLVTGALISNPRVRALASFNPSASPQRFSLEQLADGPTQDRLFMLQAGQRILKDHPLLGVGPGSLSRVYNLYRPIETGGGLELVQQLHNTPAQILAELGLAGFGGYLLWLGCLLKLGIALHQKIPAGSDRTLLHSIAASWFAYGISSLTDYQLENIGIASTLLVTTALLIHLADTHLPAAAPLVLLRRTRRILSLCLLMYLSIAVQSWARVDAGFYLAAAAEKNIEVNNLADADAQWMKASQLNAWDPTFAALSAEQLIEVARQTDDTKNKKTLIASAIASLQVAVAAAPNDPWFNQNLAVLLLPDQTKQAEQYLLHAALLFPRSQHSTYYTLGTAYLQQNKTKPATIAFVLESLANPSFLVDPLWQSDPFAKYLPAVLDQTLTAWQQVLATTAPSSHQYAWLTQQIALIQWWHHQPITPELNNLSPLTKAMINTDADTKASLDFINQALKTSTEGTAPAIALLRAWLSPENYLSDVLKNFNRAEPETQAVINNIKANRDLRKWLTSANQPADQQLRLGLSFAYRNQSAQLIRTILSADSLTNSTLINQLHLFPPPPRQFSPLDHKIIQISQSL